MACGRKHPLKPFSTLRNTPGGTSSRLLHSTTRYQSTIHIIFISSPNRPTGILQSHDLRIEDVANITLLLPSLAPKIFAAANKAYAEFFGVSPPSRACVGVDLPEGVGVILECVARKDNTRRALHVQSLSYWAPANIGPYSQAVTVCPAFCDVRGLSNI